MKITGHIGLISCAVIVSCFYLWTDGYAFDNHTYIHLVNHRDKNGNLVIPQVKQAPVPKPSIVKKTVIPAQPTQPKGSTFRNMQWGMSIPEVKTNETAKFSWELQAPILTAGDYRLGYRMTVEGIDTFLSYSFSNNQLTTTKYLFDSNHEDETLYLEDYENVKNWIVQTYGPPRSEEQLWLDDLYRYATELWGRAVKRGHLTLVAEWEMKGTTIVLLLNGGDDTVGLMVDLTNNESPSSTQLVSLPASLSGL